MNKTEELFPWSALDGLSFQSLCTHILLKEGYQVSDQGIGPDGGVDIIAVQNISLDADYAKSYKWAVQVKYRSNSSATVSPRELGNIENLLSRFQADGFLLITNGRVTAKAFAEIRSISTGGPPSYLANVWDKRVLEAKLLRSSDLRRQYFPQEPRSVLFVDDEPMILGVYANMLSAFGFRVFAARNAPDALHIAQGNTIDVAILDIRLESSDDSGMSGIELARKIRNLQPAARLIFHSAYLGTNYIRAIASLENAMLLSKFDTSSKQLRDAVENALEAPEGIVAEAAHFRVMSTLLGASLHRLTNRLRGAQLLLETWDVFKDRMPTADSRKAISDALESALSLVRRLMSEATSGVLEATQSLFQSVDLVSLVEKIASSFRGQDNSVKIAMTAEVPSLDLQCNPHSIEAILANLIENAVESRGNARIDVAVRVAILRRERDFAVVSVADNGSGIARELLGRLFEPGFTSKREGSGMGLFLSGKVAEYHGGWIEVESPAQRWSTEVRLILPCVLTATAMETPGQRGSRSIDRSATSNPSAAPDANRASRDRRR